MTYAIEHVSAFSETVQSLLEKRHFFLCARSKDVSERFQVALFLILPKMGIRNGDVWYKSV